VEESTGTRHLRGIGFAEGIGMLSPDRLHASRRGRFADAGGVSPATRHASRGR